MIKILVVDDDPNIGELLKLHLSEAGFSVTTVADGARGLEMAKTGAYTLVVLDVMLPGRNGVEVCRELRRVGTAAKILMLTSRSDEVDKVLGLEIGADDYVTKPFSIREIVARVKALLRRDLVGQGESDSTVQVGSLSVDPRSRDVVVDGQKLTLTGTEFDLLFYLAKHSGRAFTREHLLQSVWGYTSSAYEHTVNTHINRLRSKIEHDPARPRFIQTVWGVGYKCVSKDEVSAH